MFGYKNKNEISINPKKGELKESDNSLGIVDEPITNRLDDLLGIQKHSDALSKFIQHTQTPITIGIQGQWGSGKTSLLQSIKNDLANDESILQIWVNAWESSLLSNPEESFIKIINEIIQELFKGDGGLQKKKNLRSSAQNVFRGAIRIGASVAGGTVGYNVIDELMGNEEPGIKQLRKELESAVHEINTRETNPFERIVIYVDDLDRIEPKDAVKILELLKNIFNIKSCIFVLAIDYQVVVRGLKDKFNGASEDEREIRSFFDKIIQLPYMMPVSQYTIGKYIMKLLEDIKFAQFSKMSIEEKDNQEQLLTKIIQYTTGFNPRSLKRLINSLSLINIFSSMSDDESAGFNINDFISSDYEANLLFAIVCIQISYPSIYDLLTTEPNILNWDENFVFNQIPQDKFDRGNLEVALNKIKETQSEDFDEEWEENLFKICFYKEFEKSKVHDISRALSLIKDEIILSSNNNNAKPNEEMINSLGDIISYVLNKTSITNVTATNKVVVVDKEKRGLDRSQDQKDKNNILWEQIYNQLGYYKKRKKESMWGGHRKKYPPIAGKNDTTFSADFTFHLDGTMGITFPNNNKIEQNFFVANKLKQMKDHLEKRANIKLNFDVKEGREKQYIAIENEVWKNDFKSKHNLDKWYKQTKKEPVLIGLPEESWDELIHYFDSIVPIFDTVFSEAIEKIIHE